LTDSLFFADVVVEAGAPDPDTRTVPITIASVGVGRQRIRRSVGYATDTGLRAGLGVDWRRLNGAGHSAAMNLQLGQTRSDIGGQYRIPIGDPIRESLLFRGGLVREDLADLESRRATARVSRVTVSGSDWRRTVFLDLLREDTQVPGSPELNSLLVLPGAAAEKLVADDLLFPRHGYRVSSEVRGSHRALGADADFLRLEIEGVRVVAPGEHWRLFARGAVGIGLIDDVAELPASQRFFAGGDLSVRGYGFNRLGPRDELGNIIGGRHLVFGSLEVERTVWRRLALALFVDGGNAFDSLGDDLEASAGLGLNVRTPIGTVHLGWARSLTENRDARFHLTIRPDL
jgi:translocation and assembly module TamA